MGNGRDVSLGSALHGAIGRLRDRLSDPTAHIAILVPASTNGVLARQQLQLAGKYIRVSTWTPEQVVATLARMPLARQGKRRAPTGWLELALARRLPDLGLPDDLDVTLTQPGWLPAVVAALTRLERAGVGAAALHAVEPSTHRDLLGALLAEVAKMRADRGFVGPAELARLALDALDTPNGSPAHRPAGVVVLGDRIVPPDAFQVLSRWLATRAVEVVLPAPLDALAPAPRGLRRAAVTAPVAVVQPTTNTALAHLRRTLWRQPAGAAPADDTVALCRTPDETHEVAEAVREIRQAMLAGTPLDRIALAVPDASQALVVRETLRRAALPATLLVGPPATQLPTGRFLRLALDVAAGDDHLATWHTLLTSPSLRTRSQLGPDAMRGRGRWRKLLASCGASRDTSRIRRGVREIADNPETETTDREAAERLHAAMTALDTDLSALRTPRSFGGFARACARFLDRWSARSQESVQVRAVLRSYGDAGDVAPFRLARRELVRQLDATPVLEGTLNDRAIRVATPMALLGGAFDLVCVAGLVHGRFPRRAQADALLPDGLLAALRDQGHDVLLSTELAAWEDRRLAAVVGAAETRLWLSAPAYQHLEGRPTLASPLLLDVATALDGQRAGYEALDARMVRLGSRHRAFAREPGTALSPAEHRIARAWDDPIGALQWLLGDATARRVVTALLRRDERTPSVWNGFVPPGLVEIPGIDAPATARAIVDLLADPERFFVRRVLRAWPPRALPGPIDLIGDVDLHLLAAIRRALASHVDAASLLTAWQAVVHDERPLDDLDPDTLKVATRIARRRVAAVLQHGVGGAETPQLDDAAVGDWRVSGQRGIDVDAGVEEWFLKRPRNAKEALSRHAATFVHALAAGRDDAQAVVFRTVKDKPLPVTVGEVREPLVAALGQARVLTRIGWWPSGPLADAIETLRAHREEAP